MNASPYRGAKWVVAFWAIADARFLEKVRQEWDDWSAQHRDPVMASGTRFPEWSPLPVLPIDVGVDGLFQQAFAVRVVTDGRDLEWGKKALNDLLMRLSADPHAALMASLAIWEEGVAVDGSPCYLDPEPQSTGWVSWIQPGLDSHQVVGRVFQLSRSDVLRIVTRSYVGAPGEEDIDSPNLLAVVGEKALSYSHERMPEPHAAWLAHQKEKLLEGNLVPGIPPIKKRF